MPLAKDSLPLNKTLNFVFKDCQLLLTIVFFFVLQAATVSKRKIKATIF
jgi:hypothetical protein